MPLHDWSDLKGWEGVHDIWLVELLRCVKPQLPPGFRAHLGTVPTVSIDAVSDKPDVSVRHWRIEDTGASPPGAALMEPEVEVATLAIEPDERASRHRARKACRSRGDHFAAKQRSPRIALDLSERDTWVI